LEHDVDPVARGEPAPSAPRRTQHEAAATIERFEDAPHTHPIDGAVDVVGGLVAPRLVGVDGDGNEHAAVVADERRRESLRSGHDPIIAPPGANRSPTVAG
jgi:hypothetical protein